ncbi:hypothetical protein [Bacillus marinisedimentorum]|uniref:hypothetical protein n=1 Tax=Bacillus marinisedimentorum TaxID=1821260 RepID=UPI0007E09CFF|nr:hypothetical protein [Bacillus marinisedimentorum]
MRVIAAAALAVFMLFLPAWNALADGDDHESEENDKEEWLEEAGELLGVAGAAAGVGAALLFPLKRTSPFLRKKVPSAKRWISTGLKLLLKYHIMIGLAALILTVLHGAGMYISEGELGPREWLGAVSIALIAAGSAFGFILNGNKKQQLIRTIHMIILGSAGLFAAIHILLA